MEHGKLENCLYEGKCGCGGVGGRNEVERDVRSKLGVEPPVF